MKKLTSTLLLSLFSVFLYCQNTDTLPFLGSLIYQPKMSKSIIVGYKTEINYQKDVELVIVFSDSTVNVKSYDIIIDTNISWLQDRPYLRGYLSAIKAYYPFIDENNRKAFVEDVYKFLKTYFN